MLKAEGRLQSLFFSASCRRSSCLPSESSEWKANGSEQFHNVSRMPLMLYMWNTATLMVNQNQCQRIWKTNVRCRGARSDMKTKITGIVNCWYLTVPTLKRLNHHHQDPSLPQRLEAHSVHLGHFVAAAEVLLWEIRLVLLSILCLLSPVPLFPELFLPQLALLLHPLQSLVFLFLFVVLLVLLCYHLKYHCLIQLPMMNPKHLHRRFAPTPSCFVIDMMMILN